MYHKLVTKVNAIDSSEFVLKTSILTLINQLLERRKKKSIVAARKYLMLVNLLKKHTTKITEIEGKIPSITVLATTAVHNAVENKIPDVSNLVKITDYDDAKIPDIESKYFTTSKYNKFMNEIIGNKMKEKELVKKSDISGFINNSDLDNKIATLSTKTALKTEQDKITKLQASELNYFRGKSHFENDGTQNYLVFQPVSRYFKTVANNSKVAAWKSKRLSDENYKPPSASDNSFNLGIN